VSSDEQESPEAICERLVWSHNPDGLVNAPDASTTSWAGSVQQEVRMFGNRPEAGWPAAKADPYPAMALIMMVKDEGDIISENIRWHYFVGVRKFLILDNSSNDETARNLKSLSKTLTGVEFLILNDPTISYLQAQKTTGLFRLAISIWPEVRWVIPTDADEFLIPQRGFQSLELVPEHVDAVTVPKSIHFQNRIQTYRVDERFFSGMDLCSPIFEVPPKIILRADIKLAITPGNHMISRDGDDPKYDGGFKYGLYYREYPVRSFEHFLKKTRNGGRAVLAAEAQGYSVGGGHWIEAYNILQSDGEVGLWQLYQHKWISDVQERFRFKSFRGAPL
jgi:hypothetical protein